MASRQAGRQRPWRKERDTDRARHNPVGDVEKEGTLQILPPDCQVRELKRSGARESARARQRKRARGERGYDCVGSLTGEHHWPWESRGKHDEKFLDKDVPMPWDLCMAPRQPRGTE